MDEIIDYIRDGKLLRTAIWLGNSSKKLQDTQLPGPHTLYIAIEVGLQILSDIHYGVCANNA